MPKVTVQGVGDINLDQRSFLAAGGQANVYVQGNVAYKLYHDPKNMIPLGKFQELSVLNHPQIVRPQSLLLDPKNNKPIGYTMQYVKDTSALCQLFTKTFRQRNSITPEMMLKLVRMFHEMITFVHGKSILVVDMNEMNFLADNKFSGIYAIDVDSYQTANFKCPVIMDSVRDRHRTGDFNEGTDWFAWAIVSFQMLIGIHPYKGKNPKFDHLALDDRLNARMEQNVSVFNPETNVPHVCQPFDVIPPVLRSWYELVFDKGIRTAPPADYQKLGQIVTKVTTVAGSNLFMIADVGEYQGNVLGCAHGNGIRIVHTDRALYVNKQQMVCNRPNLKLGFTPKMNRPIAAWIDGGKIKIMDIQKQSEETIPIKANDIMSYGGRIYLRSGTDVLEIEFTEFADRFIPTANTVGTVLDVLDATKVLDGVIMQNLLGRWVASIFPESGKCYQINIKELDGYRVLDAKFENNVMMVVGEKGGKYDRFVFRFAPNYVAYDVRKVENVTYSGLNFTVADHGACACMNEEEKMEVMTSKKDAPSVKIMDDPALDSDMKLFHDGTKILFARGNKLYSISMKTK